MTINVRNVSGDYYLQALNGQIVINSTGSITLRTVQEAIVDAPLGRFLDSARVENSLTVITKTFIGLDSTSTVEVNARVVSDFIPQTSAVYNLGTDTNTWNKLNSEKAEFYSGDNVGNIFLRPYSPFDVYDTEENRRKGAVYFQGGVGIEKDLNVGGYIYGRIETANTTTFITSTNTNIDYDFYVSFVSTLTGTSGSLLFGDDASNYSTSVPGFRYNPFTGKITSERLDAIATITSVSPTTGAVVIGGGLGVGDNINVQNEVVAESLYPKADNSGKIGDVSLEWAESYIQDIYTKYIRTTSGPLEIAPKDPLTEIYGDIRVRGTKPIGTAPVVSNTLYVTEDGNDTNDGRAMDSSRACRTISGAVNSPYYQPGTQILVSAGHYLEDNPIRLKPYTSVRGSDIRTTFIEPINKTQDLFHLDSGCYLNYMTFLNGRSGLLEGPYLSEYNRGAYATAFPPLEGDERITLFQSPYVQNCTNQSGPWLKDGTMFVPNQTIQVPEAVGIGSWPANTASIVVTLTTGAVRNGMSINAGQQNQGFFNARTLMLSNKQFLQEQVVEYVDQTFNSGFTYDQSKCLRDVGLIVDSIAFDLLQESTSESIFAGLQYWSQSSYVDGIAGQITTTTNAINYVKYLAVTTATDASTVAIGNTVGDKFDTILYILNSGTTGITDLIVPNSTATTDASIIAAYNALISAKSSIQDQTISYINSTLSDFTDTDPNYDSGKCLRDVGLIVDSLVLDILFKDTSQSTFAGLQYWDQAGYVNGIANEITTTTSAISYLKTLVGKIILNDTSGPRYQNSINQITVLPAGTPAEVSLTNADFDVILNILNVGTAGVTDIIVPNNITASTATSVINAYSVIQQNKSYIQSEVIAFVEATKTTGFFYDQTKCRRDVAYIVDSVSFDLLYGGNKQSVQSGVYYYGFNASSSAIPTEIPYVIQAYKYIKELVVNVIQNIPVVDPYQTLQPQIFGEAGTYIEVQKAQKDIDQIINIIQNGPSVAEAPKPINLTKATETDIIAGATLLDANREFIQAEVVAFVDSFYTFLYDQRKCRRDVGYMIDSVAFDLLHGGNKQSIKSGVYYYGYDEAASTIQNEIAQTVQAYDFIKSIIPNIVTGQPLINVYQTATDQVIPGVTTGIGLTTATINEAQILQSKIDIITNIIRNGPDVVDARIPINLDKSLSSNVENAWEILLANRSFIQDETVAFIDQTAGVFEYSREKCYRDVGILVENISYDTAFGGNEKSVQAGLAYYDGVISRISGQETQTIAAIDYLNQLSQKIITNTTCTDLLSGSGTQQKLNYVLTGGEIAGNSVDSLVNIITTIIANGPSFAPEIYKTTNVDAAFVSAEILMEANKEFIQQDTINYVNNIVYRGSLPYSEIKCRRDTGLIIDSISLDLLHYTQEFSQSTFAGLQYWIQDNYVGDIEAQLVPTVKAIEYLKETASKIIQNITPANDLVDRYQTTIAQNTSLEAATQNEVTIIESLFDIIIEIVNGNRTGWTDRIISNGQASILPSIYNAFDLLQANKNYLAYETTAFVDATNFGFNYDVAKCRRDVGHMIDAICFDMIHGGNRQSVQTGLYYYGFSGATRSIHSVQTTATIAAFNYLATLTNAIIQNIPVNALQENVKQVYGVATGTQVESTILVSAINTITNIIENGTGVVSSSSYGSIAFTASIVPAVKNAYDIVISNKDFLIEEVIAYIDQTFNPGKFNYNEAKCYRDIGLIIDAVSQDILLGGNQKSIEAGLSYWSAGYNYVAGQVSTTTMAINYAKNLALQVIANKPVVPQTGTTVSQIINPYFQYGGDYMPQEAVRRNFFIITNIIENGPLYAPPVYAGGGLFALTGISIDQVQQSPQITSVEQINTNTYQIGLSKPTIGPANNATLYFGDTLVFPLRDYQVDQLSYELTGNTSTWAQRKVDQIGSMGGSLVDGGVISERSPIQSFVYDAFTQLTQGGRGVRITNDGYAQLVSVFTIFSSVGVQVDNGGIASIVNSNANFGNICLQAKGYGKRKFSGTVYNPPFKAYPPNEITDQYYPNGFWPNGGRVRIFLPDQEDRAHISLVMEVVPPDGYLNEQLFPGFLNANPNTSTISTGSITISGIDTTGIAIGNSLYIRDQFGNITGSNGLLYADTGTIVTDVSYLTVTLNKALTSGGGQLGNDNFFDLYFSGNAYYTVLSSEIGENPLPVGVNVLSTASTGGEISQIDIHIESLIYLNSLTNAVINNIVAPVYPGSTASQVINNLVIGGGQASEFINLRFNEIIEIIRAPNLEAAEAIIPPRLRITSGPEVQGAGSAVTLITNNIEFLAEQVVRFVDDNNPSPTFTFDQAKCERDSGYILEGVRYDIALGTNYNAVTSGIAYRRSVSSVVIDDQLTETLTAINYLKDQSAIAVSTSSVAVSRSNASFQETLEIIARGEEFANELVFPSPVGVNQNNVNAKNLLIANKEFLKAEVIAWISYQVINNISPFTSAFTYDSTKCARDVGYIIDGLCYDILYGGNSASIINARAYYEGTSSVIGGETAQTAAALNYLSLIIGQVVQNTDVAENAGNTVAQTIIQNQAATSTEASTLANLLQIIEDVIVSVNPDPISTLPTTVYPDISWTDSSIQYAFANLESLESTIISDMIAFVTDEFSGSFTYNKSKCKRDVKIILQRLIYDIESGGRYNSVLSGLSYWQRNGTHHIVQLGENVRRTDLFPDGATVNFYQRSYMSASGYVFEYVGAGIDYGALPQRGVADPKQGQEVVMLDSGKVFFTSTDQNGDFRIGPGLVISQATGVLSGRTFTKSLFANMTPFILAIESGGA